MSRPSKVPARCVGNPAFKPDEIIKDTARLDQTRNLLSKNDLYQASRVLLGLPEPDSYTYHAIASVKLAEVQHVVNCGGDNGLHAWYRAENGSAVSFISTRAQHYIEIREKSIREAVTNHEMQREPPAQPDIEAYISIFSPTTATASALKNFGTNAKKGSLRSETATHITGKKYIHPILLSKLTIPKCKSLPIQNPYYDFWAWSCRNLEWCGPNSSSERKSMSHHVLPILMHHFGCVTPSHESLQVLRILADGRPIADIGSGNGYWTFMLRGYGLTVHAVDNMQSEWRVTWIDDTNITDGVKWLQQNNKGKDMVLLLVYPVVGGGMGGGAEGSFTRNLVDAYEGDTVAVVGTQNRNGYTGFKSVTMDEYMARDKRDWTKVVQLPLPSFAGKDEALYVFQRGKRAPKTDQ
ncbi:hypothetical protein VFPPC_08489 [Pochonia chlamydosporia 170]|uniref:Uncharacterized protein n=1 Tax=Pochonia chlamydosporia 170 TaxID=1380566 RepID=A0A179FN74_METCM|nr:hypothetical protein VFPPC_08489 [Pochonia chlamydosporia 170]OAQ67024.1 hypothetical protein VFPPC_08489 [Pochonia chlamydosporia 170]